MIPWDNLDAAGHDFTIISGPVAGESWYYCENCGCLMLVGGGDSKVLILHVSPGSKSTLEKCKGPGHPPRKLKYKLDSHRDRDFLRMSGQTNKDLEIPRCSKCQQEFDYEGQPHPKAECVVRQIMES